MGRINKVQSYVNELFAQIPDGGERQAALIHTYGVAQICALLALKRGLDAELACIGGLLHDIYAYKTGVRRYHSINGAEMVRVIFKRELKDVFTDEEQLVIRSAIYHHADKNHIHDAYDEVLKDADGFQHWLFDVANNASISGRVTAVQSELGLPVCSAPDRLEKQVTKGFNRVLLGSIADSLAQKCIRGKRTDDDFVEIIRYFPEASAFDELVGAWCAAFVYHCVLLTGMNLPIRYAPTANTRFACVEAWLQWAQENGFTHCEKEGITPECGDIVIYNNIIPPDNKPREGPWYDHMGIVLTVYGDAVTVAEGNVDNRNVSGIVTRARNASIGCYIRIPEDYIYDGWKIDNKTGMTRVTEGM